MPEWTPARVEERLRKAIALKARLTQFGQAMPDASRRNEADFSAPLSEGTRGIGGIGRPRAGGAGDDVVRLATEALSWLHWLDAEDAGIVLGRLEGARWKMVCWRYGISRPTADRRWRFSLALIAWRLSHPESLSTPSMRSFLRPRSRTGCETFMGGTGSRRHG
jgi:hypothetical protein